MKNCPKCGKSFEGGKFCKFCGTELIEEELEDMREMFKRQIEELYYMSQERLSEAYEQFQSINFSNIDDQLSELTDVADERVKQDIKNEFIKYQKEFLKAYNEITNDNKKSLSYSNKKDKMISTIEYYEVGMCCGPNMIGMKRCDRLPDKEKANLLKFDKKLVMDDCLIIFDKSVFQNCSDGILFTLSGFYFVDGFSRHYIAYKDITDMRMETMLGENLRVEDATGKYYLMDGTNFSWDKLKNLLLKLKEIDSNNDTSYTTTAQTGKAKGAFGIRYRQGYFDGTVNGYERSSREYAIKFRNLADQFFEEKSKLEENRDEYIKLLDECKEAIRELKDQLAQKESLEYRKRLQMFMDYQDKLENL